MTWGTLLLLGILVSLDMQNLASRWGRVLRLGDETSADYTLVVPIFGDPKYFRNGDYLRRFRDQTLLAVNVDGPKMERFVKELREAGWRVHASRLTGRVSCPEIVLDALRSVETEYVIRIDGDTISHEDPGRAVAAARAAGADLCSVKITVSRRETLIEKLQAVEYDMSMLGRHNRAWMTSGACMIARTSALRGILSSHSFWFPGEDIETGVIAKHFRLAVRHVDMRFYTDAPETFRAWLRQRKMWWSGSFRMAFVNADRDTAVPAHVRVHGLRRLAAVGGEVARAGRRGPHRRDPAVRRAPLHRRLPLLELVGAIPLDGALPVLRPLPGARAAAARGALLLLALVQARDAQAAGSIPHRLAARDARPEPLGTARRPEDRVGRKGGAHYGAPTLTRTS